MTRTRRGFTLLEVLVAILVFAILFTGINAQITTSTAGLGRARLRAEAALLAETQMREILELVDSGEVLDPGQETGVYEAPHDMLRWELLIEDFAIPLSEELQPHAGGSHLFVQADQSFDTTALLRVTLRVFHEQTPDESLIEPFVIFTPLPAEEGEVPDAG